MGVRRGKGPKGMGWLGSSEGCIEGYFLLGNGDEPWAAGLFYRQAGAAPDLRGRSQASLISASEEPLRSL